VGYHIYMTDIKDFGSPSEPIQFRIGEDIFKAVPDIPAETIIRLSKNKLTLTSENGEDPFIGFKAMLAEILYEDSYKLFVSRLGDKDRPIGVQTLKDVVEWLIGEKYGMRPTQP